MGKSTAFEDAVADFSVAYADQNERDHAALVKAVRSGRIEAQTDKLGLRKSIRNWDILASAY